MRIVAGLYGGIKLKGPKKAKGIRPTTDRVREALFARLAPRIFEARVADLFAGTGALGLEAVSRGASCAILVDLSRDAISLQRENLSRCKPKPDVKILHRKVEVWLHRTRDAFDIIFADPPYGYDLKALCEAIAKAQVLDPEGILVLEHGDKDLLPPEDGRWILEDRRTYGGTCLSFYELVRGL